MIVAAFVVCCTLAVQGVFAIPFASSRSYNPFKHLVVFGDSFSDNGNGAYRITNHTWPADPAYYGGRFSNGPVWVEDVASKLHLSLTDYAVGGATSNNTLVQGYTGPNSIQPVPSALDQLNSYLASSSATSATAQETLYVILIGANDVFFLPQVNASQSVAAIASVVEKLHAKLGATNFLLATYPDLSRLPLSAYIPSSAAASLKAYTTSLRAGLFALKSHRPHLHIALADLYMLFQDFFAHPKSYGYDPSTDGKSCLTGAYSEAPRMLCSDPDNYIFWDEYHPTRKSHKYVAELAEGVIRKAFCS
ncbi:Carbohydrate esterase family 16 protein [Mycena venus]|uniref:Carbohydrate esterase family 16 protein n=1 Tax=Mycena venus TaxID=2733690 RepID=A0A8H6XMM8_9AGAR|nr:Carbohydrate esterase family 16 protein [Mycena venus]